MKSRQQTPVTGGGRDRKKRVTAPYCKPELTLFGTVRKLTAGGTQGPVEDSSSSGNKKH